jgi:hypothetical protein
MTDVFISYKREERDAITTMVERLRALKVDVWFDGQLSHRPGFDEEIAQRLQAARCVLVCWTPAAIASEWVRGEAALAHGDGKLVACFLEPTRLLPPFNLQQTEDLMRWAGQDDDPGWLRLLAAIGERLQRPGLATWTAVMQPSAPPQALRDWLTAHVDDPLADAVQARLSQLAGEDAPTRDERIALEAKARTQRRKADDARSRALAAARGLRDPAEQRRRLLALSGLLVLVAVAAAAGIGYTLDAQRRSTALGRLSGPQELRAFIERQRWHPVADEALRRYQALDTAAWLAARADGRVLTLQRYLADWQGPPEGQYLDAARQALAQAKQVQRAQQALTRLLLYHGEPHGAHDAATVAAVEAFRFKAGQPVHGAVDAPLLDALDRVLAALATIPPERLKAVRTGFPSEDDYRALAARTGLDAAMLYALRKVLATSEGFDAEGRVRVFYNPQVFSRLTKRAYDESHPVVSQTRFVTGPWLRGDRWPLIQEAWSLDPQAAYAATDFGLFGLSGQLYRRLGFDSAGEMAWFSAQSEVQQVEILVRFLQADGPLAFLKARDWRGFIRRYQGPARVEELSARLASAYQEGLERLGFFVQVLGPTAPSAASGASAATAAGAGASAPSALAPPTSK